MSTTRPTTRRAVALARAAICLCFALTVTAGAGEIKVHAVVEKSEVYLGEPFLFQIQIEGTNDATEPDLGGLAAFTVEPLGGRSSNKQMRTVVNGRIQVSVQRSFVYTYRLTAKAEGSHSIGPFVVEADSKRHRTQAVGLRVVAPEETIDFKFRLSLSKTSCYVGEPVTLTGVWYVRKSPSNVRFSLPFAAGAALHLIDPEIEQDPRREYYRVPADDGEIVLERGRGSLDGVSYTTFTFRRIVIATESGVFRLTNATVSCDASDDSVRRRRQRDPFNDPFFRDFFGRRTLRKFVTPAKAIALTVRDLPDEGRPANFAGHVGPYQIATRATPTEVNVGDPITLSISVSGPEYLEHVTLPPLAEESALARDFKIPAEMAPGEVEHGVKVFTQTIRATRSDVTEIPPIELACFDTATEKYTTVRSKAVPITVRETKVLTARDAEGVDPITIKGELKMVREGIAHNYDGFDALDNQQFGMATFVQSPWWAASVAAPLAAYLILLVWVTGHRRRHADPLMREAKRAHKRFTAAVKLLGGDADAQSKVLEEIRRYLGARLHLPAAALTYRDVNPALRRRGVDDNSLAALEALFRECEAGHYAGAGVATEGTPLGRRSLTLIAQIERGLR